MDPFLKEATELRSIITVVDSLHISHHLAKPVPVGCVNEAVEQITAADVLLLNKADLLQPTELEALETRVQKMVSKLFLNPESLPR